MTYEPTPDADLLNAATIETFVAAMGRAERVVWLQRQGVTDIELLDALLDTTDPDLETFMRRLVLDAVDLAILQGLRPEAMAAHLAAVRGGKSPAVITVKEAV